MNGPVWNVYYEDINSRKIQTFNVFDHTSFRKEVNEHLKKYSEKADFADELRSSAMYYFWSKCEYEVLICPWISIERNGAIKIDVYDQLRLNWEHFVDYVWGFKGFVHYINAHKERRTNED